MPRQDLEDLRDEIVSLGYLTTEEQYALQFYGEDRLRDVLDSLSVIAEEEQSEEEFSEDYPYEDFDDYYDYDDYWDVEGTAEYPSD